MVFSSVHSHLQMMPFNSPDNGEIYKSFIYKSFQRRDIPPMIEKMTWLEILPEVVGLLDSLKADEQRQIMAALAERYGLKITEKSSSGRSNYRPAPKRKAKAW